MDINSKKFKRKHKRLFNLGYCGECIAILTSNYTEGKLCERCERTLARHQFVMSLLKPKEGK